MLYLGVQVLLVAWKILLVCGNVGKKIIWYSIEEVNNNVAFLTVVVYFNGSTMLYDKSFASQGAFKCHAA